MPAVGVLIGGVDFSELTITLQEAKEGVEVVTIKYGAFIQTFIDFLIVTMAIFVAVKVINLMKKKEEEKPSEQPSLAMKKYYRVRYVTC